MSAFTVGAVYMGHFANNENAKIREKVGASMGLMYSMQGAKYDGGGDNLKLGYIQIPFLLHFYPVKGLSIKAGIQTGFLISAKYGDTSIYSDCQKTDCSIPVGAAYEIGKLVLDARYNLGITKFAKNGDARNNVLQFTLVYKIGL